MLELSRAMVRASILTSIGDGLGFAGDGTGAGASGRGEDGTGEGKSGCGEDGTEDDVCGCGEAGKSVEFQLRIGSRVSPRSSNMLKAHSPVCIACGELCRLTHFNSLLEARCK